MIEATSLAKRQLWGETGFVTVFEETSWGGAGSGVLFSYRGLELAGKTTEKHYEFTYNHPFVK